MQNFQTKSIPLDQRLYEIAESFPAFPPYPERQGFLASSYRVVDVTLVDGRLLPAQLVIGGALLVHVETPDFDAEDVRTITATPAEQHPDFTVTAEAALYRRGSVEQGNANRLGLFGPVDVEPEWRSAPVDVAHEEALHDDDFTYVWGDDLGATMSVPQDVRLVPDGVELLCCAASSGKWETRTVRPRESALWCLLLDSAFEIAPDYTLRHLLRLLTLPPALDREVYHRTVTAGGDSFRPWTRWVDPDADRAGLDAPILGDVGSEIEYITVLPLATHGDDAYWLSVDAVGVGPVLTGAARTIRGRTPEDPECREHYGLNGSPSLMLDCPLRCETTLSFPASTADTQVYYRGPLRAWERAGRPGLRPPKPVAFVTNQVVTLRAFLRALFAELGTGHDPEASDPAFMVALDTPRPSGEVTTATETA
jgi:hypothetical protein